MISPNIMFQFQGEFDKYYKTRKPTKLCFQVYKTFEKNLANSLFAQVNLCQFS